MAHAPLHADVRPSNVMPLSPRPRPLRASVPAFDAAHPEHLRAWEALSDFGQMQFLSAPQRAQIEQMVERLIAMLDAIDGDPDIEDSDIDCCPANDDCGAAASPCWGADYGPGDPDDAEDDEGFFLPTSKNGDSRLKIIFDYRTTCPEFFK